MPAPQSAMMKQFARLKFSSFSLRVPDQWKQPSGDPAAQHYSDAFTAAEKATMPDMTMPPLFTAVSANKYHTDTQKMLTSKFGTFIDGMCDAICSAWSQWQSTATMVGMVVAGPLVTGGQILPIPILPMILASAPKNTPQNLLYSTTIATVLNTAWTAYTASIKLAAFPAFPSYALNPPGPAVPVPNVPISLAPANPLVVQVSVGLQTAALKGQMIAQHGDPPAQYMKELYEAISEAVSQCFMTWQMSTTLQNLTVIGANPSPMTPGPVAGTAILPPGGIM
jgi:hypothetical protein